MPDEKPNAEEARKAIARATGPEAQELQIGEPLPEELTGRASGGSEDLAALFANPGAAHLADGFRGGSDDDSGSDIATTDETPADAGDKPSAA